MRGMSLPSHFYFNDPFVTFMFGGLSYSACVSSPERFAICVCVRESFGRYRSDGFVCPPASAPSGEIGPRAAGYRPMHRALMNWLRSGPE